MCAFPTDLSRTKNWGTEYLLDSDLEGQFDLIINYISSFLNASTGHAHTGASNQGPKISLTAAAGISGTLPLANGGTGQTTLAGVMNLFYPVGSVYINVSDSTNPATLFGFGTWVAIEGSVIAGYKSGDANFGTAGAVVGAATVDSSHTHGSGSYELQGGVAIQGGGGGSYVPQVTGTSASGGPATLSVIQPTLVAYVWKRTV